MGTYSPAVLNQQPSHWNDPPAEATGQDGQKKATGDPHIAAPQQDPEVRGT
jgi:hypothetical protein